MVIKFNSVHMNVHAVLKAPPQSPAPAVTPLPLPPTSPSRQQRQQ